MPIVASNWIVKNKQKEETKAPLEVKNDLVPLVPLEEVSMVPKHIENKFKKEREHGVLFGLNTKHSSYISDMLLSDNDQYK
jgi:hypothetical protein